MQGFVIHYCRNNGECYDIVSNQGVNCNQKKFKYHNHVHRMRKPTTNV